MEPAELMEPANFPPQSPLFYASNAARYDRQQAIDQYERKFDCQLVVVLDMIFDTSVPLLEDLLYDFSVDRNRELHILLASPGGDGETAVRLVRSALARCDSLTVIVPDQAKSAATLFALGADQILMGPTSDLGPVDPQFLLPGGQLASAKDIIAAVDHADERVQAAPNTYPIYASLLADITALMVQQARSALDRSDDLLAEALSANPRRRPRQIERLKSQLKKSLIEDAKTHAALFGAREAESAGLPVKRLDPTGDQWQHIWRLWTKYVTLDRFPWVRVYEGRRVSHVLQWPSGP